ncbi:hypothetical protein GIB67_042394, partial [Kingdonia uniflora]
MIAKKSFRYSSYHLVLSVKLDEWTDEQVDFLADLGGNTVANTKYEAFLPEHFQKPKPFNDRRTIRFHQSKKRFIAVGGTTTTTLLLALIPDDRESKSNYGSSVYNDPISKLNSSTPIEKSMKSEEGGSSFRSDLKMVVRHRDLAEIAAADAATA